MAADTGNVLQATEPDTRGRPNAEFHVMRILLHFFKNSKCCVTYISPTTQKTLKNKKIVLALDHLPQLGTYPKKIFQQEADRGPAIAQSPALETRY